MAYRTLQHAIASGPVKNVIVQVDFPDFLSSPSAGTEAAPFSESERRLLATRAGAPNPDRTVEIWRDRLATTLTIDALADSLRTLLDQRSDTAETMTSFGFNPLNQYFSDVKQIGYYGIFAQKRSAYESRFQLYPHPDFARPMNYAAFRDLRQIIKTAHEHGATLIIFIPPYHAQFLDIMRHVGLWSSFENWKMALESTTTRKDSLRKFSPRFFSIPVSPVDAVSTTHSH